MFVYCCTVIVMKLITYFLFRSSREAHVRVCTTLAGHECMLFLWKFDELLSLIVSIDQ